MTNLQQTKVTSGILKCVICGNETCTCITQEAERQ